MRQTWCVLVFEDKDMHICDREQAMTLANAYDDYLSTDGWKRDSGGINYCIDSPEADMAFENKGVSGSIRGQYDVPARSCTSDADALCGLEKFRQKRDVYCAN